MFAPPSTVAPRPRVLITTPVHLRTVLADQLDPPALDLIVSATAPLSQELAREAERRFGAPLLEIYGSTETGQIAIRHTAERVPFTLCPACGCAPTTVRRMPTAVTWSR